MLDKIKKFLTLKRRWWLSYSYVFNVEIDNIEIKIYLYLKKILVLYLFWYLFILTKLAVTYILTKHCLNSFFFFFEVFWNVLFSFCCHVHLYIFTSFLWKLIPFWSSQRQYLWPNNYPLLSMNDDSALRRDNKVYFKQITLITEWFYLLLSYKLHC